MAKRKRLSPALLGGSDQTPNTATDPQSGPGTRPPIAQIAMEAAEQSAFAEVAQALTDARADGRLIQRLPLATIETGHLVRDRMVFDGDDMAALKASLEARGQQVPIEVVGLGTGGYGLISGLRRVMALRQIGAEEVLALVRTPASSAEAYLAMVEENEIRAGISFYERAHLAAEAARLGLYDSSQAAIAALFPRASAPKRSKIGSFVALHTALGEVLRFPAAIPERLGLALVKAITSDASLADRLRVQLSDSIPTDAEAERAVLEAALRKPSTTARKHLPEVAPGIRLQAHKGKVVLSGSGVTEALQRDLAGWLAAR